MVASLKEAVRKWEEENKMAIGRAEEVYFSFHRPIATLDANTMSLMTSVRILSLSTNCIEKLVGFANLRNLEVLSLSRNNIKDLSGLEALSESLQELWVSYNNIEKLKVVTSLSKLRVLHISYNAIKDWKEVLKLKEMKHLTEVSFLGNPFAEAMEEEKYVVEMASRLPLLKKIDGESVEPDTE